LEVSHSDDIHPNLYLYNELQKMTTNSSEDSAFNSGKEEKKTSSVFSVKQLLWRVLLVFLVAFLLSLLRKNHLLWNEFPESSFIIPLSLGYLLVFLNWNYLVKSTILFFPIWFTASITLSFSGVLLLSIIRMPYDPSLYFWIDWLIEFLPPIIASNWLYNGYSRAARARSKIANLILVLSTLIFVILVSKANYDYYILLPFYFGFLAYGIIWIHMGKMPRIKKIRKTKNLP